MNEWSGSVKQKDKVILLYLLDETNENCGITKSMKP